MVQFNQDAYKNFLMYLLDNSFLQDNVQKLCNFLSEHIPFDKIILHEKDRGVSQSRIIFEYSLNSYTFKPKVRNTIQFMSDDVLATFYESENQQLRYWKDISLSVINKEVSTLYPECKSLIILSLYPETEQEKFQTLLFFSKRLNTFTDEHLHLVDSLQIPIQSMCEQLIDNYREQSLFLSYHGLLSSSPEKLLKQCPGLSQLNTQIQNIASSNSTILIYGETGVGKELVADTIYALSSRSENVFQVINCGALTPSLIDSELFGVIKGAYTGAFETRKGLFESAHGGTLYLDEIGELSLDAQARLLRVLEAKEIRRVGDTKRISVDVRIIAATNRDLEGMVAQGTFRGDLLYRLAVIPLYIPSLAERPEDIPILARYFYNSLILELDMATPPKFTEKTIQQLQSFTWPGNVRQLKHSIERSLVLGKNEKELNIINSIRPLNTQVNPQTTSNAMSSTTSNTMSSATSKPLGKSENITTAITRSTTNKEDSEYFEILSALSLSHNKIEGLNGAAQRMKIKPSKFRYKMKKFGIVRQEKSWTPIENYF